MSNASNLVILILILLMIGCKSSAQEGGIYDSALTLKDVSLTHLPEIVLQDRNSMDAEVVDIDGDGDLDVVLAIEFYKNVILLNDGNGIFADGSHLLPDKESKLSEPPYRYYPYHDSEDVTVEDFDKDGDLDIIVVTEDDKTNEYYSRNENGDFEDVSHQFPVAGVTNGVTAADFNNDGWIDLVMANNGQDELLMNDNGKFDVLTKSHLPQSEDITQDIEAADVDGDGDLDMIIGNENASKVYLNDGSGVFTDQTSTLFAGLDIRETREVDAGDLDGDGDEDIVLSNVVLFQKHDPSPQLLINNGGGRFTDETKKRFPLKAEKGYVDSDLIDIDGDGDLDIVMGGLDGLTIMRNNGKGIFTDHTLEIAGRKYTQMIIDIEVTDFNGDGISDVYLGTFRTGDIMLLGIH